MNSEQTASVTTSDKKKMLMTNVFLWVFAGLAHPLSHLLPTSSGEPPKIMPLLIAMLFIMLCWVSTYLLNSAIGPASED